jgi:hypothetical protein
MLPENNQTLQACLNPRRRILNPRRRILNPRRRIHVSYAYEEKDTCVI